MTGNQHTSRSDRIPAACTLDHAGHPVVVRYTAWGLRLEAAERISEIDLSPRHAFDAWLSLGAQHVVVACGGGQCVDQVVVRATSGSHLVSVDILDPSLTVDVDAMRFASYVVGDETVAIYDALGREGTRFVTLPTRLDVDDIGLCADRLLLSDHRGEVVCVDVTTAAPLWRGKNGEGDLDASAVAGSGLRFVTARVGASTARAWRAHDGGWTDFEHTRPIRWIAVAPEAAVVALGGGGSVSVYTATGMSRLDGDGPLFVDDAGRLVYMDDDLKPLTTTVAV